MTAQNVFQFAIPDADIQAGLTSGEMALTVATPIGSVPPRTSWFLSRFIILDGGNYTLKINASDPFTFSVGAGQTTMRRVLNAGPQAGFPYSADFFTRGGRIRLDVQLYNVWIKSDPYAVGETPAPSSCYAAFSIWKNGEPIYVSTAEGWYFDSSSLPDSSLGFSDDPRLALPVWSISPNWADGILERITFNTEIFTSEDDTEQRRSLARNPRRSVEASFLRNGVNQQKINNFLTGVGSRKCLVPFWPEQMAAPQELFFVGDNSYVFNAHALDGREFYDDGVLMITNPSMPGIFEVFNYVLFTQSDGSILMVFGDPGGGVKNVWPLGTRLTPMYTAYLDGTPAMQYVTDQVATAQLRFNYDDTMTNLVPSWDYCAPLWRFAIDWTSPWAETFSRLVDMLDSGIGPIDVIDYSGISRIGQTLALTLFGRDAVVSFRNFIAMARGRTVRFWLPSNHNDILPLGNSVGGTVFSGKISGYVDWLIDPQDAKLMIAIQFNTGAPVVYRRLIQVVESAGTEQFHVDEAIPNIPVNTISRISFVMPVRFDQDAFELNHVVDNLNVVTASVAIKSSDIVNMPPIDCWVTSRPYAGFAVDSLQMTAALSGTHLIQNDPEGVQMSAVAVQNISYPLTVIYTTYTMDHEGVVMSGAAVTGGTYAYFSYGNYDFGDSLLMGQASIGNVSYPNRLITYTIPVESLSMTAAAVTSGTFS